MPFSTVPGLILPGQRTMHGTRKPPSIDGALGGLERRHAAIRPGEHLGAVVGGEDDDGIVGFADILADASAERRCCRPSAPCRLLRGRNWSCCSSSPGTWAERNVQTCMRVVLCQTKNGLPSFLALSMKSHRCLDQHLVEGRHVIFGLRTACRACSGTLAMSGNGGSGPSSTIFCLPTLPQRGITVGSSVSVA